MTQIGIDIGGTSIKAAVWNDGLLVRTGQSPFYAKPTTSQLRKAIRAAVGSVDAVDTVGLCVPGLMNDAGNRVLLSVNVPGLMGIALDRLAPEALGLDDGRPTIISNDAAATAHDISRVRNLKGRLFVITIGTGVGAAVLDDGVPLDVEGGTPGHIGQIDVSIPGHDVVGPDGGMGGLEGYIGVAALQRAYGQDVSAALTRFTGDEPSILALVRTIRIAHAIYRPHHISICGGVGIRLKHLLPTLKEKIDAHLTSVARAGYTLTCGDDDFHAARGAANLASHKIQLPLDGHKPIAQIAPRYRTAAQKKMPPAPAAAT